jgi:acylphosphatase
MLKTVSIVVTGKVQGVFYRQSTREKANALGITGEVRNMPDDTVQIIATSTDDKLTQLADWCKTGPPRANVTNVLTTAIPLRSFDTFRVVR